MPPLDRRTDVSPPPDAPALRKATRAWERFVGSDGVDSAYEIEGSVPPMVAASWQRSLGSGVAPDGQCAPVAAEGDALEGLRGQRSELMAAARELMQATAQVLSESQSIMLLTDAAGIVLEAAGDTATREAGQTIHLMEGGNWNEGVIGTNGIGTAIALAAPVQIHAVEHFCAGVKQWTCAGSPIWRPGSGELLGVIDISGPPRTFQRNNLALAIASARQIESVLASHAALARHRLLEACLQRVTRLDAACVVVLDVAGRVVHAAGSLPTPDVRVGHLLPGLDAHGPIDRWADDLPACWRREGFELVRAGRVTVGAMLVLPAARPASRGSRQPSEFDPQRSGFGEILGDSAVLRAAIDRARQLRGKRVSVLIEGETGVGKELFARAVHGDEARGGPFVTFNCGATTKELIAAELFGHVRGAYTGATSEGRAGRFEQANGGSLCLDEIGELPLDLQPVLLRTLEEGVVFRLGDVHPRKVDVRVLSMTHRDLLDDIEAGRFRRDLYHRIGVTRLRVPPLRERGEDIERLTDHFNQTLAARHGEPPRCFGSEVRRVLSAYAWPGNVRELRNVVETLLLTGTQTDVTLDELPDEILHAVSACMLEAAHAAQTTAPPADGSLEASERETILRAVRQHQGNLVQAARALGIARSTLYRKVERYRLERGAGAKSDS